MLICFRIPWKWKISIRTPMKKKPKAISRTNRFSIFCPGVWGVAFGRFDIRGFAPAEAVFWEERTRWFAWTEVTQPGNTYHTKSTWRFSLEGKPNTAPAVLVSNTRADWNR